MQKLRVSIVLAGLVCGAWNRCEPIPTPPGDGEAGEGGLGSAGDGGATAGGGAAGGESGAASGEGGAPLGNAGQAEEPGVAGAGGEGGEGPRRGLVTVTVLDLVDVPTANAAVVFYEPDGGVPVIVRTGSDGVARHELEVGGNINVLLEERSASEWRREQVSVLSVKPGDELLVRNQLAESYSVPDVARVMVSFVPYPGAAYYTGNLGCVGPQGPFFRSSYAEQSPMRVSVARGCATAEGKLTLTMQAYDAKDTPIAQQVITELDAVDGATFRAEVWTEASSYLIDYVDVPAGASALRATVSLHRQQRPFWLGAARHTPPLASPLVIHPPAYDFDRADQVLSLDYEPQGSWQSHAVRLTSELPSGSRRVVLSTLPKPLREPTLELDETGVARARWQAEDGTVASSDGAIVLIHRARFTELPTSSLYEHFYWKLIGPPGTDLVPPPLPPELATSIVGAWELDLWDVSLVDATELDSYDDFRAGFGRSFGRQLTEHWAYPKPQGRDGVTQRASVSSR